MQFRSYLRMAASVALMGAAMVAQPPAGLAQLLRARAMGSRSHTRSGSYTKRGPGRRARFNPGRLAYPGELIGFDPRTRNPVYAPCGMPDGQRFTAGYMNRGEALRYIASQPTPELRAAMHACRYP